MGALTSQVLGNEVEVGIIKCRFGLADTESLQPLHREIGKDFEAGRVDKIAAIGTGIWCRVDLRIAGRAQLLARLPVPSSARSTSPSVPQIFQGNG